MWFTLRIKLSNFHQWLSLHVYHISYYRPCRSPTWQECCPGTRLHLVMWLSLLVDLCAVLSQHGVIFLVLIASITPSRWWCAWASQQQSVFWSPSSASKQKWGKKYIFFKLFYIYKKYIYTILFYIYLMYWTGYECKSWLDSSLSHQNLCAFSIQLDVTSYQGVLFVFCMVMFISGLVLAVVLPFQYVSTNCVTVTPFICHIGLEFWGFLGHSYITCEIKGKCLVWEVGSTLKWEHT